MLQITMSLRSSPVSDAETHLGKGNPLWPCNVMKVIYTAYKRDLLRSNAAGKQVSRK